MTIIIIQKSAQNVRVKGYFHVALVMGTEKLEKRVQNVMEKANMKKILINGNL